ncbi:MAG: glycosyltransferase family 4 protein [Butyrivibrio sp.]|nr:glycosyltransferase family 4 protein [Butyrivibrio sp.]
MRVLNVFYNFDQGGVERLGIAVANALASTDNESYVCVINDNRDEKLLKLFNENVHLVLLKKAEKLRKLDYLHQLISLIKTEKIDVMHVHQGTLMSFYLLVKLFCPTLRIYFTIHDTYIYSELSKKNRTIANIICNKMIAISDAVVDDMTKHGAPAEKIKRVYNGVQFTDFEVRNENIITDVPVVVNVARFYPKKKGQDTLIKAIYVLVSRGEKVKLILAGGELYEGEGSISRMKELAKTLGVQDYIEFLGNVSDVNALLKKANVFCIPSNYEGFGISAVEAMGTGLPCIASNIIGLDEVVNSDELGLKFNAGNHEELADAIQKVIHSLDSYDPKRIAQNVRERFSIETMIHELLQVYGE